MRSTFALRNTRASTWSVARRPLQTFPLLMHSSHRRRGQDKTVLSSPCQRCELNWRQVQTVLSPVISTQDKTAKELNMFSFEIFYQCSLDLSPIHFTPPTPTRQAKTVA